MNNYWSKFTRWMKYHREESNTQYIKRLCTKIADRSKIELINDIYSNLDDESREEALREITKHIHLKDLEERKIFLHTPSKKDNTFPYRGRSVLITKSYIADMGFSGNVRTPEGFIIDTPEQMYTKNGKKVIVLEELLKNERTELRREIDKVYSGRYPR